MKNKYDIFQFTIGVRPSGKKVVKMMLRLKCSEDGKPRDYFLGFLTKENIDDINKLYGEL